MPNIGPKSEDLDYQQKELSHEEVRRYSRHVTLPEVGLEGQKKLKASSVLVVGVGGLGSPASLYLAAAGVGRLGLVDFDAVDLSNLQRQILHANEDVGHPKLASAEKRLKALNPHIEINLYEARLSRENAFSLLEAYDVIVDGTDNFATRYLLNDACVLLRKPLVHGSIFRFEGQLSVFGVPGAPCYRCLYPEPPGPGEVPNCAESGVLGVLPGIIGSLQANETLKIILGIGNSLAGRLLVFDALQTEFKTFETRNDPHCLVCSEQPKITSLIDYDDFCGVKGQVPAPESVAFEISPLETKARMDRGEPLTLLDVREPHEYALVNLGAKLIPLGELGQRYEELDPAQEIIVHCHHGMRSANAVSFLRQMGFHKARNLAGGIDRWAVEVDPRMPRY